MKNKKAEAVIKRIEEASKTFRIKVLGDKQNKVYAFTILTGIQVVRTFGKDGYAGISHLTINFLKEAEIKFKILE